ncbi:MAG: thiamine-phosphate kinase [Deltaproteobacteria bacterium]|nr:thiamine-phosphate kinase [Deltaproteobacteria bacterium]
MPETLADIGEFGLIDRIDTLLQTAGARVPEATLGIGDDCALFQPRAGYELLVTCDAMVEGRHYLPQFISSLSLGRRAMTLNISDIAAMGGTPLYALISLGLRPDMPVEDVEAIYLGFVEELNPFDAVIIGGNVTKAAGANFIDITLIGEIEAGTSVRRSTARPGNAILVTGYPGQAAAGLQILLAGRAGPDLESHPLVRVYNTPVHRAREGRAVARSGLATAMIDTSDGLLGDLGHICRESGVGARIAQENLPVSRPLRETAGQMKQDPMDFVLKESDDYELIITCTPEHVDEIRSLITAQSPIPVTEIGRITDLSGDITLTSSDGVSRTIDPSGWDHFAK